MQLINNEQRHVNDVQAVNSPHQRTDDKQQQRVAAVGARRFKMSRHHLRLFAHAGEKKPDYRAADHEGNRRAEVHHRKAETHRQRVGQRRADDPCQRNLSAQDRAEHDRLAARFVRMFAGEGKHLRVRGGTKAAEENADEEQNKVVTIPREEHAGQHAHQAAEDDQLLAVAFAI